MVTVWSIIKRFIFGWLLTGVLLVIVSCVKYKEFIITAFTNNMWAWVNANANYNYNFGYWIYD